MKECMICYDVIISTSLYTVLECTHHYHTNCLKIWKNYAKEYTCPICRKLIKHKRIYIIHTR